MVGGRGEDLAGVGRGGPAQPHVQLAARAVRRHGRVVRQRGELLARAEARVAVRHQLLAHELVHRHVRLVDGAAGSGDGDTHLRQQARPQLAALDNLDLQRVLSENDLDRKYLFYRNYEVLANQLQ